MRVVKITLVLGVLTVLACSLANAAAQQRTPPGSFLRYRATTVEELTNQVTRDPVVRARFAKHFKTNPDTLAADIANEIKLVTLKDPVRVTSYYISKSGRISSKQKVLPRGTLVFADSTGKPIIAWSCGNPLSTALPRRVVKQPAQPVEEAKPMVEEIAPAVAPPAPAPEVAVVPEEVFAPIAEPLAVAPAAAEVIPPSLVPTSVISGAALLIPAFAAVIPATGGEKEIKPPKPVPEPGAAAALAAGLLAFGGAARIRRKK